MFQRGGENHRDALFFRAKIMSNIGKTIGSMRFSLNMSILGKTDQTTPHGYDKRWADLMREQFSMRLYSLKIDPRDVMPVEDRFNMIQLNTAGIWLVWFASLTP